MSLRGNAGWSLTMPWSLAIHMRWMFFFVANLDMDMNMEIKIQQNTSASTMP